MLILIAGPYRSGTADDPARMAANLHRLEAAALPLFRAGHLPLIGEWLALPLLRLAGSPGRAMRPTRKFCTRPRTAYSPNATRYCAWLAPQQVPTKTCGLRRPAVYPCTTASKTYRGIRPD